MGRQRGRGDEESCKTTAGGVHDYELEGSVGCTVRERGSIEVSLCVSLHLYQCLKNDCYIKHNSKGISLLTAVKDTDPS